MKHQSHLKTTAFLVAAALAACAANADFPTRAMSWTERDDGAPEQSCSAGVHNYAGFEVYSDGRLLVYDVVAGETDDADAFKMLGAPELIWTFEGTESNQTISNWILDEEALEVGASELQPALGADRAALRVDNYYPDNFPYNTDAAVSLLIQWLQHWCGPACSPRIEELDPLVLPPMRAAEQGQLAACLNDNHFQPGSLLQRVEVQIGGAVDWAAEAEWVAACVTPSDAPTLPTTESRRWQAYEICESYAEATPDLYGSNPPLYLCDGFATTQLSNGEELSGHQIRYKFDQALGAFPGFICPPANAGEQSSSPMAPIPRLLRNLPEAPFSLGHQLNTKAGRRR